MADIELVSHAFFAEARNRERDGEHVVKSGGAEIIAAGVDARPAYRAIGVAADQAEAEVAQEFVLDRFNQREEGSEVRDAGRIGVSKFNPAQ